MSTSSSVSIPKLVLASSPVDPTSCTLIDNSPKQKQGQGQDLPNEIFNNNDNNYLNKKDCLPVLALDQELEIDISTDKRPSSTSSSITNTSIHGLPENYKKRRKQSTPIRISCDPENHPESSAEQLDINIIKSFLQATDINLSENNQEKHDQIWDRDQEQEQDREQEQEEKKQKYNNDILTIFQKDNKQYKCKLCEKNCDSIESFQNHFEQTHLKLSIKNWLSDEVISRHIGNNTITTTITQKEQQIENNDSNRIFNLEAFCELCNKEFCNKYFLRTHKANKHKIFTESTPSEREFEQHFLQTLSDGYFDSNKSLIQVKNEQFSSSGDNDDNDKTDLQHNNDNDNESQSQLQSNLPYQNQSIETQLTKNVNSETFCEYCSKEYCNKYFLRIHKMRRHTNNVEQETQNSPLNLIINNTMQTDVNKSIIIDQNSSSTHKGHSNTNENISADLQKLQTMILHLNDIDVSKAIICQFCKKLFHNKNDFQNHLLHDHDHLQKYTDWQLLGNDEITPKLNQVDDVTTICTLCDREFHNENELKAHHLNECQNKQNNEKKSINAIPMSNYCEICNKELCNKYFMKTHMQRMHGIEIENGAQIGGVVCNICNKELCSKYFLRVHKHNTHGINDQCLSTGAINLQYESTSQPTDNEPTNMICYQLNSNNNSNSNSNSNNNNLSEVSTRYFNEICPICQRRFRSNKWLKVHLISDHGQLAVDIWEKNEQDHKLLKNPSPSISPIIPQSTLTPLKIPNTLQNNYYFQNKILEDNFNMKYNCSFCNFSTTVLSLLFAHEKSHCQADNNQTHPEPQSQLLNKSANKVKKRKFHDIINQPSTNTNCSSTITNNTSKTLSDLATRYQLAATYALPKYSPLIADQLTMQKFIISEYQQDVDQCTNNILNIPVSKFNFSENDSDNEHSLKCYKHFIPSIVFLPVLKKISKPITVQFNLNPV